MPLATPHTGHGDGLFLILCGVSMSIETFSGRQPVPCDRPCCTHSSEAPRGLLWFPPRAPFVASAPTAARMQEAHASSSWL